MLSRLLLLLLLPSMSDFRCVRRCWRRCSCKLYVTFCYCCSCSCIYVYVSISKYVCAHTRTLLMFMLICILCCIKRHLPHLPATRRCACAPSSIGTQRVPQESVRGGSLSLPPSFCLHYSSAFPSRTALSIIIAACLFAIFIHLFCFDVGTRPSQK